LDTLSQEQLKLLITSNSVNYEVIQQILAQQKRRSRTPSLDPEPRDGSKSPTPVRSPVPLPSIMDTNQQLQQLVQITPEQLQILQSQVNELLKSQHVSLPPDLTPEQQQQLIQTLLLRQLHLLQSGGTTASISLKDGSQAMKQLLSLNNGGQPTGSELTVADALNNVSAGASTAEMESGEKKKEEKIDEKPQPSKVNNFL